MIVLGKKEDNKIFQSQYCRNEKEKDVITEIIINNAIAAGIAINIVYVEDGEFDDYLNSQ